MTGLELYHPQNLAASTAMERAADFTTWAPKLQSAVAIAREICQTDFVPAALRGKPAAVAAAIMAGSEMNLGPMASLMHVHIIDDRPSLSSEMQRALVLALGHKIRYRETTATRCVVDGQRVGEADWTTVTWTMDDAKRAGLDGRQNWRKFPRRMLVARATGELCRMLFADALAGMPYSAEELQDEADDTAAATGTPEPAKPRTAQRKPRTTSASPAQPQPPHPAAPATPVQGAGEAPQPPLPGEEETPPGDAPAALPGEPDQTDYDTPGTVTTAQLTAIWSMLRQVFEFTDDEKDQARGVCAQILRRPVTTTKDMSKNEGITVLDTLTHWQNQARTAGDTPRAYLIQMLTALEEDPRDDTPDETPDA